MRGEARARGVVPGIAHGTMRSSEGVTLVELLIAACVASVVLSAAWAWLWNAGSAASAVAGRAEASTAAAFALRAVVDEVSLATGLCSPPAGLAPDRTLCLEHRHDGMAAETVLVVWDPARRVLWRKASGTYLADHVERFAVQYFRADGRCLGVADLAEVGWPQEVARVVVSVEVTVDGRTARASREVTLASKAAL